MNLTRPIVSLDLESTGLSTTSDRIIEIGMVKIHPSGEREQFSELVNPGMEISFDIEVLTGISNSELEFAAPFEAHARRILDFLDGCDLMGFNLLNFDVPLLWEELNRASYKWDLSGVRIIDVGNIYKKREARTLAAAARFYLGQEIENAHRAIGDASTTLEVMYGQIRHYGDLPMEVGELAEYSKMGDRVDLAGKIVMVDGVACYGFGKHKGQPVVAVRDFAEWMLRSDFSEQTKMVVRGILNAK